nr:P-type conjugative transfer protein TrbL [Dyella sp. ASV24]
MSRNKRIWPVFGVVAVAVLLWSHGALADTSQSSAALPSAGLLDDLARTYRDAAEGWQDKLHTIANNTFYLGAVISLGWTGIRMAIKPSNFDGIFSTVVRQVLTLGFFFLLVNEGPSFSGAIIASFQQAGMEASGSAQALSPSGIVIIGFDCLFRIFDVIGKMGWGDTAAFGLPLAFAGICILLCFAAVAILFLLVMIEAYFVMYGGIIMLGFGSMPWTRDIPKNYLVYAINVGVRIFVLYLVVTVGLGLAKEWPAMVATGTEGTDVMHNVFYIVVSALVFAAVAWKVPGIAGALTSGAVNMSAADGIGVAAGAMGMAGGAAGLGLVAAKTTGGAVMATVRGAAQAGMAGMDLARGAGASGAGAVVKGIGNAIGAAGQEAGRSASAHLGIRPQSPNAKDASGNRIGNLGTRAANNLADKVQSARESAASNQAPGTPKADTGKDVAKPVAAAANSAASTASEGEEIRHASPPSIGGAARTARSSDKHAAVSGNNSVKSLGDALSNLAPPSMPHDGGRWWCASESP